MSQNKMIGLGPQLFPGWEDSTAAGPDVLNVNLSGEPTEYVLICL